MITNDTDIKFVAIDESKLPTIEQQDGVLYFVTGQYNNQLLFQFGQQTMSSPNGDMIKYGRDE